MNTEKSVNISIIAPVHNEEENLRPFYERVGSVLSQFGGDHEIIFIDDGSQDASLTVLHELNRNDRRVKIIQFSRNFGHQIAITAGIEHCRGDVVVTIDTDLQDPPEVIADLVRAYLTGFDIVYAVRERRAGESWFKRFTAFAFYRIFNRLSSVRMPADAGDFRLMSRRAVEALNTIKERDRFIRGLVSWVGFKQTSIKYKREERKSGQTKYSVSKMTSFAFSGITSFSRVPLKLAMFMGIICGLISVIFLVVSLVYFIMGKTIVGWTSLVALIVFFGAVQLFSIGILGEYIGGIFEEVKERPLYIIENKKGL